MKAYKGHKPCAGCAVSGTEKPRPTADGLCEECNRYLEIGRGTKLDGTGFSIVYLNPSQADSISARHNKTREYPASLGAKSPIQLTGTGSKKIIEAMNKFLRTISIGEKNEYEYDFTMFRPKTYDKDYVFVFRTEVAIALCRFYDEFAKYTHNVYKAGKGDGSNLLFSLHKGDITLKELNEEL